MQLNGFIKQTSRLSGKEKAAILFSELGLAENKEFLKNFSNKELSDISGAMKRLGKSYNVHAESSVLEESLRFGMARGHVSQDFIAYAQNKAEEDVKNAQLAASKPNIDPQALAQVLSMWLKEGN